MFKYSVPVFVEYIYIATLEASGAVRPLYGSLGVNGLISLSGVHSCRRDMRREVHLTLRRQQWVSNVGSL